MTFGITTGASLGVVVNAAGVEGAGMRAVVESGAWNIGIGGAAERGACCGAYCGAVAGADGGAACTRIEAKLITASGF